ncbi:hypothetical protein C8R46DRAFT_1031457 [Mycena filopes]|nr:hypothetical protein C8R46DRAFT_1031457 [Mycena filopes]
MCRVAEWNLSQASLTYPAALAALRNLRNTHPALHAALNQTAVAIPDDEITKEVFTESDLRDDDSDIPLNVVTGLLRSGDALTVTPNFAIAEAGGITRAGDAELPDAEQSEEEISEPQARGRGQRKKIAACRYLGSAWEEH